MDNLVREVVEDAMGRIDRLLPNQQAEPLTIVPKELYRRLELCGISSPGDRDRLSREQFTALIAAQPAGEKLKVLGWVELTGLFPRS